MNLRLLLLVALGLVPAGSLRASDAESAPSEPLTLEEALTRALARNFTIAVERASFEAAFHDVRRQEGAYDVTFSLDTSFETHTDPVNSLLSGAPTGSVAPDMHTFDVQTSFSKLLPTGGTVSLFASGGRDTTNNTFALLSPDYATSIGVEVRQPLLRHLAIDPVRSQIRVARSERTRSQAALRRTVADTLAAVETDYWNLTAAIRDVDVREAAVGLAQKQLQETRDRIEAGTLPSNEEAQPRAELERRKGELLASEEQAVRAENALKAMILDSGKDPLWFVHLRPSETPETGETPTDVARDLESADKSRPEIAEARATLESRATESLAARDEKKPQLDAFASYSRRGLAGALNPEAQPFPGSPLTLPPDLDGTLGRSIGTIGDGLYPDLRVGLSLAFSLSRRAAGASAAIAEAQERRATAELERVRQAVRVEVLDATAGVGTTSERVGAARAAQEAAEVQLQSEEERFRVGISTNFLVLTRQNDLSRARLDLIEALSDHRKALTELERASGRLLGERGVVVEDAPSGASGGSK
jgi:outer membrane protein TolC